MATNIVTKRQHIQQYLQSFDFKDLFREILGWDNLKERPISILCDNDTYILRPLVEKRGVKVYVCDPTSSGNIPADPILRKIESELTKHAYEHIIIYTDAARTRQVWQWVKRGQGKSQQRLNRYYKGPSGDLLAQKLERLEVAIAEEARIHTAEMAKRTARAFDVERVTRRFYDRFKLEHSAFLQCIQGIVSQADREWYASLMLNRLMFIYFIQRKGFLGTKTPGALDGDTNYLSHHLKWVQEQRGEDQFHTFYRYFLLTLFHDGLSKREHTPELEALLGKVPYLNGGLFDIHILERTYSDINIPDEAFKKLFDFFDEFDWHLDDRPLRNDREINPDVLGYIFEKYINQKQMGAYYTKEDITEYISKNTIVPYIFDAAEQKCLIAFKPDGPVWSLLRVDPDRYLYDAVKKGCTVPLPPTIVPDVQDVMQRGDWNKPAPEPYALPTEIWREVVTRRTRYQDVKAKLDAGEITSINDLITYNLDIVTFAEDAINYCEGSDLLRAFYDSIRTVTVLDPTCGSGAFLFAALDILERLYEACLDRMQQMIEEQDLLDAALPPRKRQQHTKLDYFRTILREADKHPSRKYFIYKSIIINNLYGIDIMEEATEICKLRLFLKLVSQIEQFNHIEPLPDIDFNIRAGNTLVGFASYEETKRAIEGKTVGKGTTRDEIAFQGQMIFDDRLERIEQKAQEVERAFEHFRKLQTELQLDPTDMATNKQQMREKLGELRTELDGYLASEYGIDHGNIKRKEEYDEKFTRWQQSHQPFHWWVEFYGIMKRGGFDVIIGNPPYVEYSKIREQYKIKGYKTETCGNLYTNVLERCSSLLKNAGKSGVIIPLSGFFTERMIPYQNHLFERYNLLHISFYSGDANPSVMFNGVKHRLAIVLATSDRGKPTLVNTTNYLKWYAGERDTLFSQLTYVSCPFSIGYLRFAKVGCSRSVSVLQKMMLKTPSLGFYIRRAGQGRINYHRTPVSWIRAMNFEPYFHSASRERSVDHLRDLYFDTQKVAYSVGAILNSTLFYHWFLIQGSCRDITGFDIASFPIGVLDNQIVGALEDVFIRLMDNLRANSKRRVYNYEYSGRVEYQEFYPKHSKPIIDEIDRVLAKHYGFTDEELDFIINYDIKYRMGQDKSNEGEE